MELNGKRYYLAYGSNLDMRAMAYRCPDAKVAGMAMLKDWKMAFKVHADIVPCEGRVVPVLVWEISAGDEESLDRYEGYPMYYVKKEFPVTMTNLEGRNPVDITAMAYVMTEGHSLRKPSSSYYRVLEEGYKAFGFDTHLLELALSEAGEGGWA